MKGLEKEASPLEKAVEIHYYQGRAMWFGFGLGSGGHWFGVWAF